ncbi:MAG: hypothetical protein HY263_08985 [Chloroflexi bacterium]|nr:hypothetical protein [Chloroflexota bacterium]
MGTVRRPFIHVATGLAILALAGLSVVPVAASSRSWPAGLDKATVARMLETMPVTERATRAADFNSGRLIVFYQRMFQPVDDGGAPAGPATVLSSTDPVIDSSTRSGLYLSLSASYEYIAGQAAPYRWNLDGYWSWSPTADCCQTVADHVALAWGGSLGMTSDYAYGYYTNGASIPTYPGHRTANVGTDWYFNEWKQIDRATWKGASWGHMLATIAEAHLQNYPSGVVFEYVHTFQSPSVSLSFIVGIPTVTITPETGEWPLSDYRAVTF